jgi:hypothetical protein
MHRGMHIAFSAHQDEQANGDRREGQEAGAAACGGDRAVEVAEPAFEFEQRRWKHGGSPLDGCRQRRTWEGAPLDGRLRVARLSLTAA